MPVAQKFAPLNNGFRVPVVGFDASKLQVFELEKTLLCAIDSGYRHFHCASETENQRAVRSVLEMKLSSTTLKRADFFISLKTPITLKETQNVRSCLEEALSSLNLSFLDLYLLHNPFTFTAIENHRIPPKIIEQMWRAMEQLVDAGLVKSIGLSNFSKDQIDRLTKFCNIKPVLLHVEAAIITLNQELMEYAHSFGIQVMVHDIPASPSTLHTAFLENEALSKMARSRMKTPAQLLIRRAIQKDLIILSHTTDPQRIRSTISVFDFELSPDEVAKINAIEETAREECYDNHTN
ncbi:aldo keto reductase [Echinococcus multilocularis]|uniref:Aldo keto reductase n=1 Tax=Echinococcus multilocularis TaxID=6211 RepID=A0A087VYR9_ECHMU|nr:aldo keto reductase [Echinococcus multilocularis]